MWVIAGRGPSGQHGATPFLPQDEATNALPYLFDEKAKQNHHHRERSRVRGVDSQKITDMEKIKMWVEILKESNKTQSKFKGSVK